MTIDNNKNYITSIMTKNTDYLTKVSHTRL